MIVTRQLYEDFIGELLSFNLGQENEEVTFEYEQKKLCSHHRKKYQRYQNDKYYRNKLNNYNYIKYV
jgi:hypothetical protein